MHKNINYKNIFFTHKLTKNPTPIVYKSNSFLKKKKFLKMRFLVKNNKAVS